MPKEAMDLYGSLIAKMNELTQKAVSSSLEADLVGDLVMEALTAVNPRARYNLGQSARMQMLARRLMPDRIWDRLVLSSLNKASPQ